MDKILRQKSYDLAVQIVSEAEDGLSNAGTEGFTGPHVIEQVTNQIYILALECYQLGKKSHA